MLGKNSRVCPCCGKLLELIPPTNDLLPNRWGISKNNIPFYIPSGIHRLPYTIYPRTLSDFWGVSVEDVGNIGKFWVCNGTMSTNAPKNRGKLRLITIPRTERSLKKDKLFSGCGWGMSFFCKNCKTKLALNFNPHTIFDGMLFWGIFLTSLLLGFMMINISFEMFIILCCIPIVLCIIVILLSICSYVYIKCCFSNFVITDLRDNMIIPKAQLNVVRKGLKSIFLHQSNIFETEFDGERFCLYLTKKGKIDLKLHICGVEGEQKRLLSLIREKQERGEKVSLPLTFEGKFVGNAEVLETYDPPQYPTKER